MSRRRQVLAVLAAVLPWIAAVSPAVARGAETATQPPGVGAPAAPAALLGTCTTGLPAADRVAVFTGAMPARKAVSMAMRFDLSERQGAGGSFRQLTVPNFGEWERSQRNVAGFRYDKRVQGLQAPAAYRVTVRFRWYDGKGKVIRRATRTTPVCEQPDLRPDLRIVRLVVGGPRPDGTAVHAVSVRNAGATATTVAFATSLGVGGLALPAQSLGVLEPGGVATLQFTGRSCAPGESVVATADSDRTIDEAAEGDNVARRTCPAT